MRYWKWTLWASTAWEKIADDINFQMMMTFFMCHTTEWKERRDKSNNNDGAVTWVYTYIYRDGNIKHRRREKGDQQSWWHKINFVCHAPVSSDVTSYVPRTAVDDNQRPESEKKLLSKDSTDRLMANNESFFIDSFPVLVRPGRRRLSSWSIIIVSICRVFFCSGPNFRLYVEISTYTMGVQQPYHHR